MDCWRMEAMRMGLILELRLMLTQKGLVLVFRREESSWRRKEGLLLKGSSVLEEKVCLVLLLMVHRTLGSEKKV